MADHHGRTVLVTGATRGIGLAVAQRYAKLGASLGLIARDGDRLTEVAATLTTPTCTVAADLADPAECRRAVAEVEAALGPVEVLVSSAGLLTRDFVEDVTVEDFERDLRVNAGAGLWLSQQVLPGMRARRRGAIVFVASELGIIGAPTYASYCASKWALLGLAEVLRHELVGSGVQVCAVCPGDIRTDQLAGELEWGPTGGVDYEKALAPEDVARAIVRAADGHSPLVIVDRPLMRVAFRIMAGPRRLRFRPIHDAYKSLLAERGPRAAGAPRP